MQIIHTQLGYRPGHGRKRILVRDTAEAYGLFGAPIFWVMEQNEFSKHALNAENQHDYTYRAELTLERSDFGKWLAGDISRLRQNGVYQAFVGSHMGPTFVIRDDVCHP